MARPAVAHPLFITLVNLKLNVEPHVNVQHVDFQKSRHGAVVSVICCTPSLGIAPLSGLIKKVAA